MMDSGDFIRRGRQIEHIRHEAALAISDAEFAWGSSYWGHAVWHAFEPYLRGGDPLTWANEIEDLLPLLKASEDLAWVNLGSMLRPVIKALRVMDPGPRLDCGRCY